MVGVGGVGHVGVADKGFPAGAVFRAEFVEEDLFGAFLQEQLVDRRVSGSRRQAAIKSHQASQRLARLGRFGCRQCLDCLFQRLGHARRLEHALEFGGERGGLVVLHGDHAARVMLAGVGQLRQALAAFRCIPGVGQLHAIAAWRSALVGGADPALGRVLIVGVQHRVGVTVPVETRVPARRGQQAFAFAAVGEAAGDLPANAAGVGENHVQGDGADFTGRIRGLAGALCAGQVEERIQALVVLEIGGLQGQAETAGQGLAAVEQGAVAGFVHHFANRPLALGEVGFVTHGGRQPFAVVLVVQRAALALDLLQEQVLGIAFDGAHAPRHFAVEARQQGRQTGNRGADRLVFRRANLHVVPRRRCLWLGREVVGQQTFAAAAALRADGPVA